MIDRRQVHSMALSLRLSDSEIEIYRVGLKWENRIYITTLRKNGY